MLRAESVSRSIGASVVLDRVSLTLDGDDRVGVVGPNGVGKSTLLRILGGIERPDGGEVVRAPTTLTVGHLPQEAEGRPGERLLGHLERRTGVAAASLELDEQTAALTHDPDATDTYYRALETFLAVGGDDFAVRAAEVCERVGLSAGDLGQDVATLSGGEATRAALAAILLAQVDVLLLDEPTNNLDFAGLDLLEGFLDRFAGAVLVCRTIARSSTAASGASSRSTSTATGSPSSPGAGPPTPPPVSWPERSSTRPTTSS